MTAALSVNEVGFASDTTSEMSAEHARRVAAVLDASDDVSAGLSLPLLWHWAFFTPTVPTADLGRDGHPRMTPGGPTAGLPRRMWAGGRVRAHHPLVVGQPASRHSRVVSAQRKSGRSGELLIVTVEHEIDQAGRVVLTEEQDLVYRSASSAPIDAPAGDETIVAPAAGWSERVTMDPIVLFRFSAVTFNSHRIHYDLPYATAEEGYPDLVVHGPLTAILLAESARRRGCAPTMFEFRASAPLFAGSPFTIVGVSVGDSVELRAVRNYGTVATTARAA